MVAGVQEPLFFGIDLAWGSRNPSGGAVMRGSRLLAATGSLGSDEEIVAFVGEHLAEAAPCIVAVDAPLRVTNPSGRRVCDAELSREYHAFEAGALPANRSLALFQPEPRGERLVRLLRDAYGVTETAQIDRHDQRRLVCELFPHPAHVMLFDLERTLKYKSKPGRTAATIGAALAEYQALLGTLATAHPPLHGLADVVQGNALLLRGRARKAREDSLDAITCAYVACWAWTHGPAGQRWYGSLEAGSILTPWRAEAATARAIAARAHMGAAAKADTLHP
jgi:predicted RNase H-like nuclease